MSQKPTLTTSASPRQTSIQMPITPRLVTIKQAAPYCSCSVGRFDRSMGRRSSVPARLAITL